MSAVTQAATAAPSEDEATQLEEVIITARKQAESLQEVPLSVVAVSGEQLEQRSIENLADLGQATPNFTFSQTLNGGSLSGIAFIRGVGQNDASPAYDPAVGMYVDGIYMGRMYANNLDMLELERVEVLRGPQGTLFGKNTSGGAINVVTKQPDAASGASQGRVQVTSGSFSRFDVVGNANIPLIADKLALRLAGSRLMKDGYGKRVDFQDMADTNRSAVRAQLLIRPTEKLSALLSGDWTHFDESNASFKLVGVNTNAGPVAAYNANFDPDYDNRWLSPSDYTYNGTGPNSARGTVWGTSLVFTLDMGGATLKSITGYRAMDVHTDLDPDGAPIVIINKFEHAEQDQLSQELQAAGKAFNDRLDWVTGAYYFHEQTEDTDRFNLVTALFGGAADFSRFLPVENESLAFYGQGSFRIVESLRLTAGVRYTQDDKTIQTTQFNSVGGIVYTTPVSTHSSNAWSPRLGLDYQWTRDVMTYVSVAQGAKNGGFNGRAGRLSDFTEFDDETVWTYEAGLRSDYLDGSVRFNATAFYSKYSDLQMQISGSTVVNGAPAPFSLITNIPEATIKGGEVEVLVAPARGWTCSGGLGLTYAEYTELPTDDQFVTSGAVNKDSKFPNTPEVSFALGVAYTRALAMGVDVTARADYAHKSKIDYLVENTAASKQPAYGLLNARLTLDTPYDLSVSLFGTNLTDEAYIVGAFDDANRKNPGLGFAVVNQGPPREFGISVQKNF